VKVPVRDFNQQIPVSDSYDAFLGSPVNKDGKCTKELKRVIMMGKMLTQN
jgi:hypothetical protein